MVENINNISLEIISLFRTNYLGQFHIRQMANLIGKSHVSLLPYLRKLEENKVLISKEVGKSKVYTLNLRNIIGKELLSIAEKKKSLEIINKDIFIKKLYEEALTLNLTGSLVLFGSYASNTYTKESDIDLLYVGEIKENNTKKIKEMAKIYNKSIHLVPMMLMQFKEQLSEHSALIKEIINNHVLLFNQDRFINEVWRHYNEKKE